MSGVSTDAFNPDLKAVLGDGETFAARLTELRQARIEYDRALEELALGKSARAANDEAHRLLEATKAQCAEDKAAIETEISTLRETFLKWSGDSKAKIDALMAATVADNERAKAERARAEELQRQAERAYEAALSDIQKLKAQADEDAKAIVAAAQEMAAKTIEDSQKLADEAIATLARAKQVEADFQRRIDVLQTAASAVLR